MQYQLDRSDPSDPSDRCLDLSDPSNPWDLCLKHLSSLYIQWDPWVPSHPSIRWAP